MTKKLICISCPIGCRLSLNIQDDLIEVSGNKCKRGEVYGKEEYLAPKRVVTASCPTNSSLHPRIPVKTDGPILKEHINLLIKDIYKTIIKVPVNINTVILENYQDTGINVLTTKSLKE